MENQHRHIKGYRDLSEEEIALMNEIKTKGKELEDLMTKVNSHINLQTVSANNSPTTDEIERIDAAQPRRWLAIARTDFQTGLMALTRAVAQPTFF